MDQFVINGGSRLCGRLTVKGSKNATLPLMAAAREAGLVPGLPARSAVAVAKFVALIDRLGEFAALPVEEILGHVLTESGYEAALRLAQREIEDAHFEAARRTLEQLETHPDRTGKRGQDAAALLALVAQYLNRTEVWRESAQWSGTDPAGAKAGQAVQWPDGALQRGLTPMDRGPHADLARGALPANNR